MHFAYRVLLKNPSKNLRSTELLSHQYYNALKFLGDQPMRLIFAGEVPFHEIGLTISDQYLGMRKLHDASDVTLLFNPFTPSCPQVLLSQPWRGQNP